MAKKITVDGDICIGCGACVDNSTDSETKEACFELNDEGKSKPIKEYSEETAELIQAAIDGCPVDAIKLSDE